MADGEFIITLKVTWPINESDSWTDPHQWNWLSAVTGLTGRNGTKVEILNLSPTRFEDEEDKKRMHAPGVLARERWERDRAEGDG